MLVSFLLFQRCSWQSYLDDIGPPRVLRADTGDSDGLPELVDEAVLQGVDLLEVRVEVRHLGIFVVEVRPLGVGNAIRSVFVESLKRGSESARWRTREEVSTNAVRAYSRWSQTGRCEGARTCFSMQEGEGQLPHQA